MQPAAPGAVNQQGLSGVCFAQELRQLPDAAGVFLRGLSPLACRERPPNQFLEQRHLPQLLRSAGTG
jgi:hypothetical protein